MVNSAPFWLLIKLQQMKQNHFGYVQSNTFVIFYKIYKIIFTKITAVKLIIKIHIENKLLLTSCWDGAPERIMFHIYCREARQAQIRHSISETTPIEKHFMQTENTTTKTRNKTTIFQKTYHFRKFRYILRKLTKYSTRLLRCFVCFVFLI